MTRRPIALANWKMSMTVAESLAFVWEFQALAGDLLDRIDVVICPPFTALWPVAKALRGSHIQLGGQNIAPSADLARTGEISAALLADAGCRWVMLGHWEVRRNQGDDDELVNLACPDVDGLGATRRGRDAATFAEIVRQIACAKLE